MYRAFIKELDRKGGSNIVPEESIQKDATVDENVSKEVNRLWKVTEKQCADGKSHTNNPNDSTFIDLGWIVIRVFVSSTFNDFFNEREILVKKVFPELREWCNVRGMKFVECDLRWGIPKDTSTGDTILVCLDEIQRCKDENRDLPFFIGLLGERYGWIPKPEEVPEEAREKYDWVDGTSITFNEILVGAYRDQNPNAAFFLRDESISKSVPESFQQRFVESDELPRHHLKIMKEKILKRFPNQVYPYSCKLEGISTETGREQVKISELDDFAEKVSTFLKSTIDRNYPDVTRKAYLDKDSAKFEKSMQRLFVLDKAKCLIGRQAELDLLKSFAGCGSANDLVRTDGSDSRMRKAENWDLRDTDTKLCVVHGQSGLGKTALLCHFVDDCVKKDINIFYHMVGSTPSSIRPEILLGDLLEAVAVSGKEIEEDKTAEDCQNVSQLQKQLNKALSAFREQPDKSLVICIDALDQLESRDTLDHLSWLPPTFPHNVRCIVSTSLHRPTTSRLYEYPALKMNLQPLLEDQLQQIMTRYLGNFSKKLEPGQVEKIIKNTAADSPLWVMYMAEELRIFGDFRLIAQRIERFPSSLDEFLVQILGRLIQEDDVQGIIKKFLCLVACSKSGGLPSQSLLRLCGDVKSKEELPLIYWARARRTLKPYIRVSMVLDDVITFAHQAVFKAVYTLLLQTEASLKEWYILLADYYQTWCTEPRVKVFNLPYYLQRANLKKRLVEFVTQDKDAYTLLRPWERSHMLETSRCRGLADSVMPNTAPVLMCHSCATFSRFHPSCTWPTKDCCMLCSNYCGSELKPVLARACAMHAAGRGPNRYKCLKCNAVVQEKSTTLPKPMVPIPAKLCSHCGFGNNGRRCAHFTV